MSDAAIEKITDNVSSLQRDMAQVGTLVERLDVTIEKLTEVSSTVTQLLAVQGNRLEVQERVQEKLQDLVEKRRTEAEQNVKDIYSKITLVETELQKDMDDNHEKVIKKIEELQTDSNTHHQKMNDRISNIERWMWTLLGGSIILAFILNNADLIISLLT